MESNPQPKTSGVFRWMPGLQLFKTYKREWLLKDFIASVVLTAVLIPVGMGYSQAAGLPAIYGLYATIIPLLVYALFGPSKILVVGPDSALAGIIAATIGPLAAGSVERAVALAGVLAVISGIFCIIAGLARFGFITDLLSKPVRLGFLNGIALTVFVSQTPKILGFSAPGDNLVEQIASIATGIAQGKINWISFAIGLASLVIILSFKKWFKKIPGVLVAVVLMTVVTAIFGLDTKVVGVLPSGLPLPALPYASWNDIRQLVPGAIAIALVAIADTSVLSRTLAIRGKYKVDSDQEMVALGAMQVATGFFQGFAISSSSSRTPVAEAAGSQTQLTGIFGAILVSLLLVAAPSLMSTLPFAVLGAVVLSACFSLVEIKEVVRLWRLRRLEFFLSVICFLGVALIGVIEGIFFAVLIALGAFVWRAWKPYDAVLGRVDGLKGYHDMTRYPDARRIPGLVLFRWDAPLFFANAPTFREHILEAIEASPTPVKWVIVAAEPVTDIDITAADVLLELDQELEERKIELGFAGMKDPVKDHLKRYGAFHALGPQNFFPTLGQAVDRYLDVNQVEWVDWEELKKEKEKKKPAELL